MRQLSPIKTGVALGAAVGLWHVFWVVLVATGNAQFVIGVILHLHFIATNISIAPFQIDKAIVLVGLTSAVGAIFGAVFAFIWNSLHPREAPSSL